VFLNNYGKVLYKSGLGYNKLAK